MKQLFLNLTIALSLCYLLIYGLFAFDPHVAEHSNGLRNLFDNIYYFYGAVITLAFSCMSFGGMIKKAERVRQFNALRDEMAAQRQRLVDYIKLASLITRKDADKLIDDYVSEVETKYKLEVTDDTEKDG